MSQNFSINGLLKINQTITEADKEFWNNVLTAAIYDPRKVLVDGVATTMDEYEGDMAESYEGDLDDGDEFDDPANFDVNESFEPTADEEEPDVATFSSLQDIVLSGCYFLEEYIADVTKVVYLTAVEKGVKACLTIGHTYLDRGPDDEETVKWAEMVEKFGRSA